MVASLFSDEELAAVATGRQRSIFAGDRDRFSNILNDAFRGRRILVVGGAGSIGSATVRALLDLMPAAVHVADVNENGLAELVRELRTSGRTMPRDLRLWPVDFGSSIMRDAVTANGPYDCVLNLAALKHVRSEKDVWSLRSLFDTNVFKVDDFMGWLVEAKACRRYYGVSTDKAANPVNLMGASKRLMELTMFTRSQDMVVSAARFANVAFSAGGLLDAIRWRIVKRQPVMAPSGVLRFFVSPAEAADICLLAAAAAPSGSVAIPKDGLLELQDIAEVVDRVVRHLGFEPAHYDSDADARRHFDRDLARGAYPIGVTPPDTMGEKAFEEFIGSDDEELAEISPSLAGLRPRDFDAGVDYSAIAELRRVIRTAGLDTDKAAVVARVEEILPSFRHAFSAASLDERA